ncbi:hypothetical protein, partial [Brevibacterium linens]|uniref:hypothetical protein n=1 Tax=Brevibacterium linens TaxID=1703 RepID=UPI001C60F8AA
TGPASQRLVFFIGEDQFSFRTTGARHTPFYNFLHEFTAQDTSLSTTVTVPLQQDHLRSVDSQA